MRNWFLVGWFAIFVVLGLMGCADETTSSAPSADLRIHMRGPQPTAMLQDTSRPFIRVGPSGLPEGELIAELIKRSVFKCEGTVPEWLVEHARAELMTLASLDNYRRAAMGFCAIEFETENRRAIGNPMMHFFDSASNAKLCLVNFKCSGARNVRLVARQDGLYRSYFMFDQTGGRYSQHCVTPRMLWAPGATCYTVESPVMGYRLGR